MKDKILLGLFVVLAFSIGFTIGGIGNKGASIDAVPSTSANTSAEHSLESVGKVLEPFLEDYRQRYATLDVERVQLRVELEKAKQDMAAIQGSGDTVSVLKSQVKQQQFEIGGLKVSLQNAVDDSTSWHQYAEGLTETVGDTQRLLTASQDKYDTFRSKLSVVNGHTSATVNEFTAEERDAFYKVWDEWWESVVVLAD